MKYSFGDDESSIKELEITKPDKKAQAILQTPESMTNEDAARIREDIVQSGYKVIAGEDAGKPVLKISGFDSANNFLGTMADNGTVIGDFKAEKTAIDDHKKDKGDNSKLALLGAGACFAVASTAILAAGTIRQSVGEIAQGFVGIFPAAGLMWASQQTPETQMSYLYRDLREFSENNNLRINNDVRSIFTEQEAPNDLFHNVQRGVFENGPTANNLIKAIAISAGTQGAFQQGNYWKTAGNAIAVTGLLAANALPEKHVEQHSSVFLGNEEGRKSGEVSEPPEQKKGFIGETISKLTANPQMIGGGFAMVQQALKYIGNIKHDKIVEAEFRVEETKNRPIFEASRNESMANAVTALTEGNIDGANKYTTEAKGLFDELQHLDDYDTKYKRYGNAVIADRISMVGYTVGYALYTQTKKHNGSKLELDPIMEICANMVHDYPVDQQKAVTQRLAGFLGNHDYVSETVDDLVSKINHKVAVLASSPWLGNKPANNIVTFDNFATRLDGAQQTQVEHSWHKDVTQQNVVQQDGAQQLGVQGNAAISVTPNSILIDAKRQSLEKLVASEKQVAMSV